MGGACLHGARWVNSEEVWTVTQHTEEEAAKRWCPFSRYRSINGEGINRWASATDVQMNPLPARCIGSQCMAWRWKLDEGQPTHQTQGRCGLVGK